MERQCSHDSRNRVYFFHNSETASISTTMSPVCPTVQYHWDINVPLIQMVVKPSVFFVFPQPSFHFIISVQDAAYQFTQTFFHNFHAQCRLWSHKHPECCHSSPRLFQLEGEEDIPFCHFHSTNQLDWPLAPTSTLAVWKVNTHFIWNIKPSYSTLPCHSSAPIGHLMIQVVLHGQKTNHEKRFSLNLTHMKNIYIQWRKDISKITLLFSNIYLYTVPINNFKRI